MSTPPKVEQDEEGNQRSDQVEPMHRGARAEADQFASGHREKDSERGPAASEQETASGGSTGEHSGQDPDGPTTRDK
jgi:hypothetical protein